MGIENYGYTRRPIGTKNMRKTASLLSLYIYFISTHFIMDSLCCCFLNCDQQLSELDDLWLGVYSVLSKQNKSQNLSEVKTEKL